MIEDRSEGRRRMADERREAPRAAGKRAFAAIFLVAGIGHFAATDFFMKVMPPEIPYHRELVLISGAIEVTLGAMLLIPRTTRLAGWGLIALLIAVFPANIYVYRHPELFPLPQFVHLLRLPLQGVLIYWAYRFTRRDPRATAEAVR